MAALLATHAGRPSVVHHMLAAALAAADPGLAVERALVWVGPSRLRILCSPGAAVGDGVLPVPVPPLLPPPLAAAVGSGVTPPSRSPSAVEVALDGFRSAIVLGAGKAAVPMAAALARVLAASPCPLPVTGTVVTKYGHSPGGATSVPGAPGIAVLEAAHPVPDAAGAAAAAALLAGAAGAAAAQAIVFVVLSGGASALTPAPPPGVTLADLAALSSALLACGAPIDAMNAVRKHCSMLSGGRLAAAAGAAPVISLVLSDVVGDRLDVIGSGPTVPDATTFADAAAVLSRYALRAALPPAIVGRIDAGVAGTVPDTPKAGRPHDVATVVASNADALAAAAAAAAAAGYAPYTLTTRLEGEAAEVGKLLAGIAVDAAAPAGACPRPSAFTPPAVILAGGEPTVTLGPDPGAGGRNQELVLAAVAAFQRLAPGDAAAARRVTFMSCGTDGTDGPTDAAGAALSPAAASPGVAAALARHDAYTYYAAATAAAPPGVPPAVTLPPASGHPAISVTAGGHIITGPTGTNVMDVVAVIVD